MASKGLKLIFNYKVLIGFPILIIIMLPIMIRYIYPPRISDYKQYHNIELFRTQVGHIIRKAGKLELINVPCIDNISPLELFINDYTIAFRCNDGSVNYTRGIYSGPSYEEWYFFSSFPGDRILPDKDMLDSIQGLNNKSREIYKNDEHIVLRELFDLVKINNVVILFYYRFYIEYIWGEYDNSYLDTDNGKVKMVYTGRERGYRESIVGHLSGYEIFIWNEGNWSSYSHTEDALLSECFIPGDEFGSFKKIIPMDVDNCVDKIENIEYLFKQSYYNTPEEEYYRWTCGYHVSETECNSKLKKYMSTAIYDNINSKFSLQGNLSGKPVNLSSIEKSIGIIEWNVLVLKYILE